MLFSCPFDEESPRQYRIASLALFDDLNAVEIGYNRPPKGLHQVMKRDVYILHYVIQGRGTFCHKAIGKNVCYVVVPGELETVTADRQDPYECYWIMFKGSAARHLLTKCNLPGHNDVVAFDGVSACARILKEALLGTTFANEWEEAAVMNAALQQILALHFAQLPPEPSVESVPQKVMRFINQNYYNNITVESIAKHFNYSRNYLYTLFKQDYGVSPQAYLLHRRIEKAKELLLNDSPLLISEIALAVGYSDALYFSRVFRKRVGVSPKEFMEMNKK